MNTDNKAKISISKISYIFYETVLSQFNKVNFYLDTEKHPILDSKVHGANMGPTWDLSAQDGPHVGPMNLAIRGILPMKRV